MLAAVVLASWLAQAEPAPVAPPAPVAAPAPVAPPAPVTAPVAEPAPAPQPQPGASFEGPQLANGVRVHGSFAYRLPTGGASLGPDAGFSLSAAYERRYTIISASSFGVAVDASFTRFALGVTGSSMTAPGQETTYAAERALSQTSFAVLQTANWRFTRVTPFAAVGAGLTIGYFSSPELELRPGSARSTQPLLRGVAGLEIPFSPTTALSIRATYTYTFNRPTFTTDAAVSYSLFGSLLDLGAGMSVLF